MASKCEKRRAEISANSSTPIKEVGLGDGLHKVSRKRGRPKLQATSFSDVQEGQRALKVARLSPSVQLRPSNIVDFKGTVASSPRYVNSNGAWGNMTPPASPDAGIFDENLPYMNEYPTTMKQLSMQFPTEGVVAQCTNIQQRQDRPHLQPRTRRTTQSQVQPLQVPAPTAYVTIDCGLACLGCTQKVQVPIPHVYGDLIMCEFCELSRPVSAWDLSIPSSGYAFPTLVPLTPESSDPSLSFTSDWNFSPMDQQADLFPAENNTSLDLNGLTANLIPTANDVELNGGLELACHNETISWTNYIDGSMDEYL